jgi:hypothetical protein
MTEIIEDFQRYISLGVRDTLLEDKVNKNLIRLNLSRLESSYPFNLAIRFQTAINEVYESENIDIRLWLRSINRETKFCTINGGYEKYIEDYFIGYDLLGSDIREYKRPYSLRLPPAGDNFFIYQTYFGSMSQSVFTEISENEIFANIEYIAETFRYDQQLDRNRLK